MTLSYLARRLGQAVLVLWAAWTVAFVVLDLLPGDPISTMAAGGLDAAPPDPARIEQLKAEYGYDQPIVVRYLTGLGHVLHGDLGTSVQTGERVTTMIAQSLPSTLVLTVTALVLAVAGGLAVALAAAWSRNDRITQILLSVPTLGVSLPTFWVGLMLIQVISFRWHLLPALGDDGPQRLILPAVTLALPTGAILSQILARGLAGAMADPYVQTASAKGAGRARVLLRHALPNATIPALTVAGVLAGNLLAGSVVVETVFSRAGLGRITIAAVDTQDLPVVQGVVVLGAAVFVLTNLVVDLLYPLLDPRILTGATAPAVSA